MNELIKPIFLIGIDVLFIIATIIYIDVFWFQVWALFVLLILLSIDIAKLLKAIFGESFIKRVLQ